MMATIQSNVPPPPIYEQDWLRLAPYCVTPDPGQSPPDLAQLDPDSFTGSRAKIAARGLKAGLDLAQLTRLIPELPRLLAQADPDADPADLWAAHLAQRWKLYGPDFLLQPPEPPKYLVQGMIRQGALVCIYGAPGSLKSMIAQDLAVCVAGGLDWLDPLPDGRGSGGPYAVTQAPTLWVDQDNGKDRLRERFGALLRARKLDSNTPLQMISLPVPFFDASQFEEAQTLAAQIQALGAGLCAIDNLGTVSGGRDENASEMVAVMSHLRWIAEETGCTIVVVHHARKGNGGSGREGDRLRGHSSIEASLDLALIAEREADDLTLRSTKTRDDPVRPFVAKWTYTKNGDGALDIARFYHVRTEAPQVPEYIQIARELPDLLDGNGADSHNAFRKQIMEEFECSKNTADRAIASAVSDGLIKEEREGGHTTAPKRYMRIDVYDSATQGTYPL